MSNDRFKFRIWEVDEEQYRNNKNCNPVTDFLLDTQNGQIQTGEGWEVYGDDADNLILEQSTGIKDRSGKLIYEGDIVKSIISDEYFAITWREDLASFGMVSDVDIASFDNFYGTDLEIIGNIHENPEILENDDDGN